MERPTETIEAANTATIAISALPQHIKTAEPRFYVYDYGSSRSPGSAPAPSESVSSSYPPSTIARQPKSCILIIFRTLTSTSVYILLSG